MTRCKPAESLLAERENERECGGKCLAKRQLEAGELHSHSMHVLLCSLCLAACAAVQLSMVLPSHPGVLFRRRAGGIIARITFLPQLVAFKYY